MFRNNSSGAGVANYKRPARTRKGAIPAIICDASPAAMHVAIHSVWAFDEALPERRLGHIVRRYGADGWISPSYRLALRLLLVLKNLKESRRESGVAGPSSRGGFIRSACS